MGRWKSFVSTLIQPFTISGCRSHFGSRCMTCTAIHATHRMGGLFRMGAGETCTGIGLHDPRARLRAPLEPQRRPAVGWNRRFQHCAGLVRKSARPFSPDDPYSLRGSTQSCPGLVGTPGAMFEDVDLEYAYVCFGGVDSHTGPSHWPPAPGH